MHFSATSQEEGARYEQGGEKRGDTITWLHIVFLLNGILKKMRDD